MSRDCWDMEIFETTTIVGRLVQRGLPLAIKWWFGCFNL